MAFFEILELPNTSFQKVMTMRLLMETAADMWFMAKNPNNLDRLNKKLKQLERKKSVTRREIAKHSQKLYLRREHDNNITASNIERIQECFTEDFMIEIYNYCCAYVHCNFEGIYWDFKRIKQKGETKNEIKFVTKLLPHVYIKMCEALSEILEIDLDIENQVSWLKNVMQDVENG